MARGYPNDLIRRGKERASTKSRTEMLKSDAANNITIARVPFVTTFYPSNLVAERIISRNQPNPSQPGLPKLKTRICNKARELILTIFFNGIQSTLKKAALPKRRRVTTLKITALNYAAPGFSIFVVSYEAMRKILSGNSKKGFLECENKGFKKHLPALFPR